MDKRKIIQYIKGDHLSEKEFTEILDWIESSQKNRKQYEELKQLWVLSGMKSIAPNYSLKFFKKESRVNELLLNQTILKYVAVFILAFFIGGLSLHFVNSSFRTAVAYNEIQVPVGEKSTITLYDGTKVWLNSGTSLRYPAIFCKKQRKVFVNGEAFFDVAKNKHQPFVVNANQLDIRVLGTRFNVCAYRGESEYQVTLEEGSVHAKASSSKNWVVISPGEQVTYDQNTSRINKRRVNTDLYSSWKENILRFEDAPFSDVVKKMERWYGVKIILDETINLDETYTLTIKTESLKEMLNLLSKTNQIKYKIIENKVLITKP